MSGNLRAKSYTTWRGRGGYKGRVLHPISVRPCDHSLPMHLKVVAGLEASLQLATVPRPQHQLDALPTPLLWLRGEETEAELAVSLTLLTPAGGPQRGNPTQVNSSHQHRLRHTHLHPCLFSDGAELLLLDFGSLPLLLRSRGWGGMGGRGGSDYSPQEAVSKHMQTHKGREGCVHTTGERDAHTQREREGCTHTHKGREGCTHLEYLFLVCPQ